LLKWQKLMATIMPYTVPAAARGTNVAGAAAC
jgi:hypothetical protein